MVNTVLNTMTAEAFGIVGAFIHLRYWYPIGQISVGWAIR